MSAAAILLMIVGCNGSLEDCRELPAPEPFYSSIETCEADNVLAAVHHSGDFDQVFGACAVFDEGLVGSDAEIVWDVSRDEGLTVAVEPITGEAVYVLARNPEPSLQKH